MAVGQRVRVERAKLGLTQGELAGLTGIDRTKIAKIESGVRDVQVGEAPRLASALRIEVAELLRPTERTRMRVDRDRPATEKAIAWFEHCIDDSLFVRRLVEHDGR